MTSLSVTPICHQNLSPLVEKTFLYSLCRQSSSTVTVISADSASHETENSGVGPHEGAASVAVTEPIIALAATKSFILDFFFQIQKLVFCFDENLDFDFAFIVEIFWRQRVDGALEIILMKIIFLKGEEEGILKIFRRLPF